MTKWAQSLTIFKNAGKKKNWKKHQATFVNYTSFREVYAGRRTSKRHHANVTKFLWTGRVTFEIKKRKVTQKCTQRKRWVLQKQKLQKYREHYSLCTHLARTRLKLITVTRNITESCHTPLVTLGKMRHIRNLLALIIIEHITLLHGSKVYKENTPHHAS